MAQLRSITRHLGGSLRASPLTLLMSVLALGLCFFFLGLCGFALLRQDVLAPEWLAPDRLVAYLGGDIPEQDLDQMVKVVSGWPEVEGVVAVSREQAHQRLEALLGQSKSVLDGLGRDFLPPSLQITVKPSSVQPGALDGLASKLRNLPAVEEILYGKEPQEWLQSLAGQWTHVWLILVGLLLCVATLITSGVVGQGVASRKSEVSVYRLVGATPLLVKLPYYVEGILMGVLGAFLGAGLLALLAGQVRRVLPSFWGMVVGPVGLELVPLAAGLMACGALTGWLGSRMGLGRSL